MLLSHLGEYACKWPYECIRLQFRNDCKKFVGVPKHSWGVCKHSQGLGKIRNMLLKFRKEKHIRNIFVSNHKPFLLMARHLW